MNDQLIAEHQELFQKLNDTLAGMYKNSGDLNVARSRRARQLSLEMTKFQKKLREQISEEQGKARSK